MSHNFGAGKTQKHLSLTCRPRATCCDILKCEQVCCIILVDCCSVLTKRRTSSLRDLNCVSSTGMPCLMNMSRVSHAVCRMQSVTTSVIRNQPSQKNMHHSISMIDFLLIELGLSGITDLQSTRGIGIGGGDFDYIQKLFQSLHHGEPRVQCRRSRRTTGLFRTFDEV